VAILRKRAALDGVHIDDPRVLELLAERVTDNVRALEGALIRVVAYHSLSRKPITLELAQIVLDGMNYPQPERTPGRSAKVSRPLSIEAVKHTVAAHYGLTVDDLISSSRAARVAWPRQMAIHLARELTDASLSAIGDAFGGRNHATVVHALKRVAERASEDQQTAVDIDELSRELRNRGVDRDC
jgi:chromosomal replication initiator protein